MTLILHMKGQAASGIMVQRPVCMEMRVSVCPVPVHQLSSTSETPDLLPVIVPVMLCCAQNSFYFLIGIIFFLMPFRRNQLELSEEPSFEKESKVRPLFQEEQ